MESNQYWYLVVSKQSRHPALEGVQHSFKFKINGNPVKIGGIQALEGIQHSFTFKIKGIQHMSYSKRLKAIKISSLKRRRERFIILTMWKVLYLPHNDLNISPNDLNIRFDLQTPADLVSEQLCQSLQ